MQFSLVGLALGLAYLTVPIYWIVKVALTQSFGGLWSQEFALFVVTLPGSPLAEKLFKRHNYARLGAYFVCGLLNAAILYFLGWGVSLLMQYSFLSERR